MSGTGVTDHAGSGQATGFLDRFFHISARGSTVPRECLGGVTTFGAMSYILVVHPLIMSQAGLDRHLQLVITAWIGFACTLVVALWARLPLAVAPGMATNILFAQVVVHQLGIPPQVGLVMTLVSGLLFSGLALSGWRQKLLMALPGGIRAGVQCGLGLLIAGVGLNNGGLVTHTPHGVHMAGLGTPAVLYTACGVIFTLVLYAMRLPGALPVSIGVLTAGGFFVPLPSGAPMTMLPAQLVDYPSLPTGYFMAMDFGGYMHNLSAMLPLTTYYFLSEFFAASAAIVAVAGRPPLSPGKGVIANGRRLFLCDSIAEVVSAVLGTSTAGAFLESSAGIEAGARTGLASVVTALFFLASLCLWPILTAIPAQATAPALILIGLAMLRCLSEIDMDVIEDWAPALLTIVIMAAAGDFMVALTAGCLSHTAITVGKGHWRTLSVPVLLLDAMLVTNLILKTQIL